MIHPNPHPQAGKTVRIKPNVAYPGLPHFGGSEVRIEDWWDRLARRSWMDCVGNAACLLYAMRTGLSPTPIPNDDEVVYAKLNGLCYLLHVSELEPA